MYTKKVGSIRPAGPCKSNLFWLPEAKFSIDSYIYNTHNWYLFEISQPTCQLARVPALVITPLHSSERRVV